MNVKDNNTPFSLMLLNSRASNYCFTDQNPFNSYIPLGQPITSLGAVNNLSFQITDKRSVKISISSGKE